MGKVEDLIFACAPLGIITAIVAAIRVGGPGALQAIIGRARESKGVVEVELMSSTSANVCELWSGQRVVRVLGSSPIIELYYLQSDLGSTLNSGATGDDAISLIERDKDLGIWDFKSAISTGLLKRDRNPPEPHPSAFPGSPSLHEVVPNIGLNLSGQRVSNLEFMLVAVTGILLQAGVVVFAAVGVYLPTWNERFEKAGKSVRGHSFPSMASGTVALVIGMFLCCYIVERSTAEDTWVISEPEGHRVRVAWLQKGGEVNEQHFKSYILHRSPKSSEFWNAMPKFIKALFYTDTRLLIRTSRQGSPKNQVPLTMVAVITSVAGFVLQFVGLRALTWQVTIAQLVATGAMTGLRAMVRRNLIHKPKDEEIKVSGYELEAMAMKIRGCHRWDVAAWEPSPGGGLIGANNSLVRAPSVPSRRSDAAAAAAGGFRFATEVMDARRRLGALSMWSSGCQRTAGIVVQAIEASMDFLWTNPDVNLSNTRPSDIFEWKLFVEVSKASGGGAGSTTEFVQLTVSRKILPSGAWGPWKAIRNEIEAVLGLWMHHLKIVESGEGPPAPNLESDWRRDEQAMGITKTYRTVGNGDPANETVYKRWLLPQTELAFTDARNIIGRPNRQGTQCLSVLSETPLEMICGQHIYSTFLADIVDRAVDSLNGRVLVRGSEQGIRDSFGLRNTVIDGLLNEVERTGLATPDDALLSIIPALGGKYSTSASTTEAFSDLANEISTYLEGSRFERAEALLLWLLDVTESDAKRHEEERNWREACKAYILLLKTYTNIGSGSYARRTEEAIGLFCERFHSSQRTVGEGATRKTLDLVEEVLGDMEMSSWGENGKILEARLNRRGQAGSLVPTGKAGDRLRSAAANGDYLGVVRALQMPGIDINSDDSLGRTPLILACRSGRANIIRKLLHQNADPSHTDGYRRTAIHYAARRNDTSALHALLLHKNAGEVIDALDGGNKSALDLAIQCNAGAAVALLIFYGAKDREGSAKELLKLSAHRGSYAAANVVLDNNCKDGKYGRTSLHWAVWRGEVAAAELLLRESVDIEARGCDGLTALHLAAGCGCDSAIEFLIRQLGANINAEARDGKMALHFACTNGQDSTAQLLIREFNAQRSHRDGTSRTPLQLLVIFMYLPHCLGNRLMTDAWLTTWRLDLTVCKLPYLNPLSHRSS